MRPSDSASNHFEYAKMTTNQLQSEKDAPRYIKHHLGVSLSNIAAGLKDLSQAVNQIYALLETMKKSG